MLDTLVTNLGRGLLAGFAGTAALTVAQLIEMKISGRPPSMVPAQAVEKTLGIKPKDQPSAQRMSNAVHWVYGTTWGAVRGVLSTAGLRGLGATGAHFAAVWGTELLMLPALKLSPPAYAWSRSTLAKDGLFHAIYAGAAGAVFALLTGGRR